MNRVIYKYPLKAVGWNEVRVEPYPVVRCVHEQHGLPTVWVEVNDTDGGAPVIRNFFVAPTGGLIPLGVTYCGTAFVGTLVWHVYVEDA